MSLFRKKPKVKVDPDYEFMISRIRTSMSDMTFDISPEEEKFFRVLVKSTNKPWKIRLVRLKNGTFNVSTSEEYLGKICLQDKIKFIQYIDSKDNPISVEGDSADDLIPYISKWFKK